MKKILVKNRSDNPIGYDIPDLHLHRDFAPYEEKEIDAVEMEKLSYQDGGQILIDNYFQIKDAEIAEKLSPSFAQEPEYNYTKEDITRIILNGSLDEFLDCLDFAPPGVAETIKNLCITLPATDTRKMDAVKDKFGIDIAAAIRHHQESLEEDAAEAPSTKTRRAAVPTAERRAESAYKVVTRK